MTDNDYLVATPGDFFCPAGGSWYACETGTKFVGCCASNPCINHCIGDQLRPAGFSTRVYTRSPGGTCGGDTGFWTCTAGSTYWGCCNADPCQNNSTCPVGKLEPTVMDRPDQLEYFGALNRLMDVASPLTIDASTASSDGPSGAVIGGAVGGAVFLLAIIGALVFFLCRRRRRKQRLASGAEAGGQDGAAAAAAAMKQNKDAFATMSPQASGLSPPPMYSSEQHAYHQGLQELPTDRTAVSGWNRYSELEGQSTVSLFSELPDTGAARLSELESPQVSPKVAQTGSKPGLKPGQSGQAVQSVQAGRGLGVMMEGEGGRI